MATLDWKKINAICKDLDEGKSYYEFSNRKDFLTYIAQGIMSCSLYEITPEKAKEILIPKFSDLIINN